MSTLQIAVALLGGAATLLMAFGYGWVAGRDSMREQQAEAMAGRQQRDKRVR